jgi:hypothetical protein
VRLHLRWEALCLDRDCGWRSGPIFFKRRAVNVGQRHEDYHDIAINRSFIK